MTDKEKIKYYSDLYDELTKMHKECKEHNAHLIKLLDKKDQLLSDRSVRIINLENKLNSWQTQI